MYLHLAQDSPFVDHFIDYFDKIDKNNVFVVFGQQLKYTRNKERVLLVRDFMELNLMGYSALDYKKVFIHFLGRDATKFVLHNKRYPDFYWFFWGADGYNIPELKFKIFLPETSKILRVSSSFKDMLRKIKNYIGLLILKSDKYNAVKHINYCCTWVIGDFELAKRINPNIKLVLFSYLSSEELFKDEKIGDFNSNIDGNYNILIGNSLNSSNNHIDAILYLKQLDMDIHEVVFPLSYSGSEEYKSEIKCLAKQIWNSKAIFLEEFMPLNQYLDVLSKIDIVIFFHLRQQAANNALSLLWMGKIIIMHPQSLLFKTLSNWGLSVVSSGSVNSNVDFRRYNEYFENRLETNRYILRSKFSKQAVNEYYNSLCDD